MAQNIDDIVDEFENDELVGSANSFGFTGAKIGRFIAVGLFLALGTFAVIYSMSRGGDSHADHDNCLLYTSPSPRDLSTSRMPSSA